MLSGSFDCDLGASILGDLLFCQSSTGPGFLHLGRMNILSHELFQALTKVFSANA